MKEIPTAEEYRSDYLKLMVDAGKLTEEDIMKAYATMIVESVTDEEIRRNTIREHGFNGAQFAREIMIKRIK